jgi:N-acetylglucosamine-6-phosphate deacetylase
LATARATAGEWTVGLSYCTSSKKRLGAQPPFALLPWPSLVQELLELEVVRVLTMAPEVAGAHDAAERFARAGVRVSLGHAQSSYEAAVNMIEGIVRAGGTPGGTHFLNAMGGLEARSSGLAGALLADPRAFLEIIVDMEHVHPALVKLACDVARDRTVLVTDAIRGAGLPDGGSELVGQRVTVAGGCARLEDGTLAGSVLTLDRALRNAVSTGCHSTALRGCCRTCPHGSSV